MTTNAVTDTAGVDDVSAARKTVVVRVTAAMMTTNAVTGTVGTDVVNGEVAVETADVKATNAGHLTISATRSVVMDCAATLTVASCALTSARTTTMMGRLLMRLLMPQLSLLTQLPLASS